MLLKFYDKKMSRRLVNRTAPLIINWLVPYSEGKFLLHDIGKPLEDSNLVFRRFEGYIHLKKFVLG